MATAPMVFGVPSLIDCMKGRSNFEAGAALGVQEAADVLRAAVARSNGRRACHRAAVPIEIVQPCPLLGSALPGRRTGVGPDPLVRN